MNKIQECYENPFDIILIRISEKISPLFYKLNFTPNEITTLSVVFGMLSIYLMYKDHYILSILSLLLSYFFDVLDSFYARTYNMTTKFGNYYDHISDIITTLGIMIMIYYKTQNKTKLIPYFIIFVIFVILSWIHLGCQQKVYDSDDELVSSLKKLCPESNKMIKYTRFFGGGTLVLVMVIIKLATKNL